MNLLLPGDQERPEGGPGIVTFYQNGGHSSVEVIGEGKGKEEARREEAGGGAGLI